jgi:hypothetical protein
LGGETDSLGVDLVEEAPAVGGDEQGVVGYSESQTVDPLQAVLGPVRYVQYQPNLVIAAIGRAYRSDNRRYVNSAEVAAAGSGPCGVTSAKTNR